MQRHRPPGHGLTFKTVCVQVLLFFFSHGHLTAYFDYVVVDPAQLASPLPPVPPLCSHETCKGCWNLYPQSLYPNWTPAQVKKSKINKAITDYGHNVPCIIHQVDVDHNGLFKVPEPGKIRSGDDCLDETWEALINSNVSTVCTWFLFGVISLLCRKYMTCLFLSPIDQDPFQLSVSYAKLFSLCVRFLTIIEWDVYSSKTYLVQSYKC